MDVLKILEEKLATLIELVKELKTENAELAQDNAQLKMKLSMLEKSLQGDEQCLQELKQEKELTKLCVDDLIKSIEALVENQSLAQ